jgi:hypothetical protein
MRADTEPNGSPSLPDPYVALLTQLALSDSEAKTLTDEDLVLKLVASGMSRLTGERIVAIGRGGAEPGRARRHTQSRALGAGHTSR